MEPFQMGSEIQIGSFNLPRIVFANTMTLCGNRFVITLPVIGIIIPNWKSRQFIKKLLTDFIGSFPILIGQNGSTGSFKRIPRPPLVGFVAHIAPELIRFHANVNLKHGQGVRLQAFGESLVDLDGCFFFSSAITVFFAIPSVRLISLTPLPLRVCISICSFVPGSQAE
jgi:hypothetical protein